LDRIRHFYLDLTSRALTTKDTKLHEGKNHDRYYDSLPFGHSVQG
jgi:hypothetical protein